MKFEIDEKCAGCGAPVQGMRIVPMIRKPGWFWVVGGPRNPNAKKGKRTPEGKFYHNSECIEGSS